MGSARGTPSRVNVVAPTRVVHGEHAVDVRIETRAPGGAERSRLRRAGSAVVMRSSMGPSACTATWRMDVSSESPTARLLTMSAVPSTEPLMMSIASVRRRAI